MLHDWFEIVQHYGFTLIYLIQVQEHETTVVDKESLIYEKQQELEQLRRKRCSTQDKLVYFTTQVTVPQHKVKELENEVNLFLLSKSVFQWNQFIII